jgi:CHAT domain-containing protein
MAGADRLLMSLWKVDDEATQQFMIAFYQEWSNINNIDLAFQKAQQSVKEKFPEPFYWGAFVLNGKPGELLELFCSRGSNYLNAGDFYNRSSVTG